MPASKHRPHRFGGLKTLEGHAEDPHPQMSLTAELARVARAQDVDTRSAVTCVDGKIFDRTYDAAV